MPDWNGYAHREYDLQLLSAGGGTRCLSGPMYWRLQLTGSTFWGAAMIGGGLMFSDIGVTIPNGQCPPASGTPLTLQPLTIAHTVNVNQAPLSKVNATAVNQVVTSPASNLAFVTYDGATPGALLPYYVPAAGSAAGTVNYLTLNERHCSQHNRYRSAGRRLQPRRLDLFRFHGGRQHDSLHQRAACHQQPGESGLPADQSEPAGLYAGNGFGLHAYRSVVEPGGGYGYCRQTSFDHVSLNAATNQQKGRPCAGLSVATDTDSMRSISSGFREKSGAPRPLPAAR